MRYSDLIEKEVRGTADLPIAYFNVDENHLRYEMPLHWHPEMEILRVREGKFTLSLNENTYQLCAGDVAIVNAGVLHRGEPTDCKYDCIVFHLEALCTGAAALPYVKPLLDGERSVAELFLSDSSPEVRSSLDKLFTALRERPEHFTLSVYAALYEFILALYSGGHVKASVISGTKRKHLARLRAILDWIDTHHTEHITLNALSRLSGFDEKYLCRFFKEYTAATPIEYVNRLRIERAIEGMRERHLSITEAAFENGFNDSAYFSKIFRSVKGMSPREYRRKYLSQNSNL